MNDAFEIQSKGKVENGWLIDVFLPSVCDAGLVIEDIQCFGSAVGREVFETVRFSGRLQQKWLMLTSKETTFQQTTEARKYMTGSPRAKDSFVRRGVLDFYANLTGLTEDTALIGKKKKPGVLYGVTADTWMAVAHALTWFGTLNKYERGF